VRVINHGAYAGLATFGGILIIGALVGRGNMAAVIFAASAGLVGSALWAQTIEGSPSLLRPFGFYGGLLGVSIGALAAPLFGTPIWLLLAACCVSGPWVQSVGRLRCLVQGCCHGSLAPAGVGISYAHQRSRVCRLSDLGGKPIHATPLYSILWNVVIALAMGRLWSLHVPLHFIGGVYLILNGLGRFVEEAYRGEPQTPVYRGLRAYQWVALATVVIGAVITAVASSPGAPPPSWTWTTPVAALGFGLVSAFALGVDFPDSSRRFARLV
jgi:hypothetical protein